MVSSILIDMGDAAINPVLPVTPAVVENHVLPVFFVCDDLHLKVFLVAQTIAQILDDAAGDASVFCYFFHAAVFFQFDVINRKAKFNSPKPPPPPPLSAP